MSELRKYIDIINESQKEETGKRPEEHPAVSKLMKLKKDQEADTFKTPFSSMSTEPYPLEERMESSINDKNELNIENIKIESKKFTPNEIIRKISFFVLKSIISSRYVSDNPERDEKKALVLLNKMRIKGIDIDPLERDFMWDGETIALQNTPSNIIHDIAHYQMAAKERRFKPEYGLGGGPETGDYNKAADVRKEMNIDLKFASLEETTSSLLGILWEWSLGVSNPYNTMLEHAWIDTYQEILKIDFDHFDKTFNSLKSHGMINEKGIPTFLLSLTGYIQENLENNTIFESNIDVNYLKSRYDYYNKMLFNNELPDIPILYKKLKNVGGSVKYTVIRKPNMPSFMKYRGATLELDTMKMYISSMYNRNEQDLDAIIIHEMIHVYFAIRNDFAQQHGYEFIKMVKEFSAKVGFEIPEKEDYVDELQLNDKTIKPVIAIILEKKDGSFAFAIMSAQKLNEYLPMIKARWENALHYSFTGMKVYTIATPEWTNAAYKYPVQRKMDMNTTYYKLNSEVLIDDILKNGKIVYEIKK